MIPQRPVLRSAFLAGLAAAPAIAAAQPDCPTIRAITNVDGRQFADVRIGIERPFALTIRADGHGEGMAAPGCDFAAQSDGVDISCYWERTDFATSTAFYDALFARLQQCLGDRLAPPAGPTPYGGDATALRSSTTSLPAGDGTSEVDLVLIEITSSGPGSNHYVSLSVYHSPTDD